MKSSLKLDTNALLVPFEESLGISSTDQLILPKPELFIADNSISFDSPSET